MAFTIHLKVASLHICEDGEVLQHVSINRIVRLNLWKKRMYNVMTQESDDIYLLTEVASLYYEENYTQEQIAKVIGVSRSGVSRLLTRSRELGLVDIQVHHALRVSAPLRDELMQRFGLHDAQVLLSSSTDDSV